MASMGLRERLPWRLRIAAKMVLSRLPIDYGAWRRLSIFHHGDMDRPEYASNVFHRHYDRVLLPERPEGVVGLELGPGDSLASAFIGRSTDSVKSGWWTSEGLSARISNLIRNLHGFSVMVD